MPMSRRMPVSEWALSGGSLTAMTFGGAVEGIGFDVRGLGDGGVSLISTHDCNDQGDGQREDLDCQQDDRLADALCRVLKEGLVMSVYVVEVGRSRCLHPA
jgi:hypothetical protein